MLLVLLHASLHAHAMNSERFITNCAGRLPAVEERVKLCKQGSKWDIECFNARLASYLQCSAVPEVLDTGTHNKSIIQSSAASSVPEASTFWWYLLLIVYQSCGENHRNGKTYQIGDAFKDGTNQFSNFMIEWNQTTPGFSLTLKGQRGLLKG